MQNLTPTETVSLKDLLESTNLNNKLLRELIHLEKFSLLGPDRICRIVYGHQTVLVHVPLGDLDYIQRKLVDTRTFYGIKILKQIEGMIGPDSIVADIGANIGNHTLFFALCCKAKHVHAFEPIRSNFEILTKNIEINHLPNVTAHNVPVGRSGERVGIGSYKITNTGGTTLVAAPTGEMVLTSLDDLDLPRLDFVKIDVEGMQREVLLGSVETLRRFKPAVMVEIRKSEIEDTALVMNEINMVQVMQLGPFDFLYRFRD